MTLVTKRKPVTTIHHKRRVGTHHKKSKNYHKPYWPYLPLLLIVGVGLLFNSIWNGRGHVLGDTTGFSSVQLLSDTNKQRTAKNESSLQLSSLLSDAAQAKAEDMAQQNYWSHDSPSGKTPWDFITGANYQYGAAGENLAYGFDSSSAVINGWMHSQEHRSNMLDAKFQDVGFGIVQARNFQGNGPETIVVAMYARPAGATISAVVEQQHILGAIKVQPPSVAVARVQTLSAGATWSLALVGIVGLLACTWYLLRHALAVKRVLIHGEAFVIHHHFFDFVVVTIATLAFVLTQTGGFIH
jgi:hypothetical protein